MHSLLRTENKLPSASRGLRERRYSPVSQNRARPWIQQPRRHVPLSSRASIKQLEYPSVPGAFCLMKKQAHSRRCSDSGDDYRRPLSSRTLSQFVPEAEFSPRLVHPRVARPSAPSCRCLTLSVPRLWTRRIARGSNQDT